MGKRRMLWITLAAGGIAVAAWFLTRPRPPIVWIGEEPPLDFEFSESFTQKPVIDWNLPFAQISIPPRRMAGYEIDPQAICGFLEGRDRGSKVLHTAHIVDGKDGIPLPIFTEGLAAEHGQGSGMVDWKGNKVDLGYAPPDRADRHFIGLPFATDEAFRRVKLWIDGKTYEVNLPVSIRYGQARLKPETIKRPDYTLTFDAAEWRYTTLEPNVSVSANLPPGRALLLNDGSHGWLLEGKKREWVRSLAGGFAGKAIDLGTKRIKLRAKKVGNDFELRTLDGKLAADSTDFHTNTCNRFFILWAKGRWIAGQHGLGLGNGPEELDWDAIQHLRDGEIVDAIAYERLDSWDMNARLGYPPASYLPMVTRADP